MIGLKCASSDVDALLPLLGRREVAVVNARVLNLLNALLDHVAPVALRPIVLLLNCMLEAAPHPLRQGRVEDLPYFARQERLTFERVGVIEPVSVARGYR